MKRERVARVPSFLIGFGWLNEVGLRALDSGGQATKGAWGMSRHQEALKGAEDCDKPGGTVKQVMIPGFLNRL